MDKALVYGTRDSGFDPQRRRKGRATWGEERLPREERDWKRNPSPQPLTKAIRPDRRWRRRRSTTRSSGRSTMSVPPLPIDPACPSSYCSLRCQVPWFESVAPVAIVLVLRDLNTCDDDLPLHRIDSTARLRYLVCAELWV
nr:unnamed protein product [Digitaria exilis]